MKANLSCFLIILIAVDLENVFHSIRICHSECKCHYLKNKKTFYQFFVQFLGSTSNFKRFENKDDCHS